MSDPEKEKLLYCSFCGKSQEEIRKMIAGPSVFICDECVELCLELIRDNKTTFPRSASQLMASLPHTPETDELVKRVKDILTGVTSRYTTHLDLLKAVNQWEATAPTPPSADSS